MKYLTITVPCFNSEKYLRRCLDSLMIGGNDVEIIVVDDGSTDQTGEIADLYAKWFPEIVTVVHHSLLYGYQFVSVLSGQRGSVCE